MNERNNLPRSESGAGPREQAIQDLRAGKPLRDVLPTRFHAPECACLLCEWLPVLEAGLDALRPEEPPPLDRNEFLSRCTERQRTGTHGESFSGKPCSQRAERCVQCVIDQSLAELAEVASLRAQLTEAQQARDQMSIDASQRKDEIFKLISEVLHERDKVEEMAQRADRYLTRAEAAEATLASLRQLSQKWRNRAAPNFADPEATEDTLAYWAGAKQCAKELDAALAGAGPTPTPTQIVTRFEVIDDNGRVLVRNPCSVRLSFQDDGRTLKVFVSDAEIIRPEGPTPTQEPTP
jgi:hypothetical protein